MYFEKLKSGHIQFIHLIPDRYFLVPLAFPFKFNFPAAVYTPLEITDGFETIQFDAF